MQAGKMWQPLGNKDRGWTGFNQGKLFDNKNWNGSALLSYRTVYFEVFHSLRVKSILEISRASIVFCVLNNHSAFLSFPLGSILTCTQNHSIMCQGLTHFSPAPESDTWSVPGRSEYMGLSTTITGSEMCTYPRTRACADTHTHWTNKNMTVSHWIFAIIRRKELSLERGWKNSKLRSFMS